MVLIDNLPDELILHIIFNLNLYDINELTLCSHKFKNIIKQNSYYLYKNRKYIKPHGLIKNSNSEIVYVDGLKHGNFIYNYYDNIIHIKGIYFKNKKHGTWYHYSERGSLIKEENWESNLLNGYVKTWYNNNYIKSIEYFINNKKHGEQIYFTIDRNIIYEYWTYDNKDYDITIIKYKQFKIE
jgi:antitoxin component YwqK of YwqJK toxin-antitoxin module